MATRYKEEDLMEGLTGTIHEVRDSAVVCVCVSVCVVVVSVMLCAAYCERDAV